eukprot:1156449-Pelagomonas_calceolata.AAC.10
MHAPESTARPIGQLLGHWVLNDWVLVGVQGKSATLGIDVCAHGSMRLTFCMESISLTICHFVSQQLQHSGGNSHRLRNNPSAEWALAQERACIMPWLVRQVALPNDRGLVLFKHPEGTACLSRGCIMPCWLAKRVLRCHRGPPPCNPSTDLYSMCFFKVEKVESTGVRNMMPPAEELLLYHPNYYHLHSVPGKPGKTHRKAAHPPSSPQASRAVEIPLSSFPNQLPSPGATLFY